MRQLRKSTAAFLCVDNCSAEAVVDGQYFAANLVLAYDCIIDLNSLYCSCDYCIGGVDVSAYTDFVAVLYFMVDYLLFLGTNRLCGYPPGWGRAAAAAALGAAHATACMLPQLSFLKGVAWRIVCLLIMVLVAFGINRGTLRRGSIFVLLSMALGGIAMGMEKPGVVSVVIAAVVLCGLCWIGFRERPGSTSYVPVTLSYAGKRVHLTALRDTGNTLRDPISGAPVLIVGADVAKSLTGLTHQQLQSPVQVLQQAKIPGLRLIPYRTVGQPTGMLLAIRINDVRVGEWKGSSLVAFAPEGLDKEDGYQALTGGMI